jgi:hypothetical protein
MPRLRAIRPERIDIGVHFRADALGADLCAGTDVFSVGLAME